MEESGCGVIELLSRHFPVQGLKKATKILCHDICVSADIQTEHFSNTNRAILLGQGARYCGIEHYFHTQS
jgi:hypothetical protein